MTERGMQLEDLPGVYREEFLYGVEMARARNDPCQDWEGFRERLWSYLVPAFGLDAEGVQRQAAAVDEASAGVDRGDG